MVFPLHNNLTSDATVLHYSSTVLSKHCCYISKLRQWDLGYIRHFVPTQPIPRFYAHQHWCVEITTYRDWVLIKETPEDQYHTNILLANSKTKTTQKVLRLPHTLSPSPHYTYTDTHVGYSCVSFLLSMCRLCGNYLIPNNLQSCTWPQLCMCSSSPLRVLGYYLYLNRQAICDQFSCWANIQGPHPSFGVTMESDPVTQPTASYGAPSII